MNAFYLIMALVLILLNAFFVLAEFATVRIRPSRIEELIDQGNSRAKLVQHIHEHLDEYLSVCQVGITLASIGLGFVGEQALAGILQPIFHWLGAASVAASHSIAITISYIVVSFVHILIGELIPKRIAIRDASVALLTAQPLRLFRFAFSPALWVINYSASGMFRMLGLPRKVREEQHSEEELRIILAKSQTRGLLSFRRLLLLENVFDLGGLKVRDAMRPSSLVRSIDVSAPWEQSYKIIRESRFSRLPLIDPQLGKPIGILHIKDLIIGAQTPHEPRTEIELRKLARPFVTTSEETPLENLLAEFQRRRMHLAIALDRSGKWTGLITMEDILEEIVGSVEDEFEIEPHILLADALSVGRIVLGVEAPSIEGAIRLALSRVPKQDLALPAETIAQLVTDRAKTVSPYLGHGLSIPHARADGLERAILVFARSELGIPVAGKRPEHARLIFILVTPAHQPHIHVRLLARIAGLIESEFVEERLREATSANEVLEAIRTGESAALG